MPTAPFAGWLTVFAVEAYLSSVSFAPAASSTQALEATLCLAAASAQATLLATQRGPRWLRSPAMPAVALLVLPATHMYASLLSPLFWAWGALLGWLLLRVIGPGVRRAPHRLGVATVLLVALPSRFLVLTAHQGFARTSLTPTLEQVRRPLTARMQAGRTASDAPPIVLVTIDTLRADAARTMPIWRHLEARGAIWERALSTSSWTLPAVSSLLTGRMPAEHRAGRTRTGYSAVDAEVPLIAEDLLGSGYRTAAWVVNPFLSQGLGLSRGFELWSNPDDNPDQPLIFTGPVGLGRRDGRHAVDGALAWMSEQSDAGWALWIHLFDPHLPYLQVPKTHRMASVDHGEALRGFTEPADREAARDGYAIQVAYTDTLLTQVVRTLEARDFFATGLLIVTSDHGEEFWEHGGAEHGHTHHGEVVDVPLAVLAPGLAAGQRRGEASGRDVAATIRAFAGLPHEGLDLREPLPEDRIVTAAGTLYGLDRRSARGRGRRAIASGLETVTTRVYDLTTDPLELVPLEPDDADPVVRQAQAVRSVVQALEGIEDADFHQRALEEIGYIE